MKAGLLALVVVAAFATGAQASNRSSDRVEDIVSQQRQIRADVKAEKNGWDNIADDKRQELLGKQDQLLGLIEGKQSLDELAPEQRATAVETLAWIDNLTSKAADERKVCTRERATGSNRVTTVCRSVAAEKKRREQALDAMRTGRTFRMDPATAGAQ